MEPPPPPPPPPNRWCSADGVITVFLDDEDGGDGPVQVEGDDEIPSWLRQLVAEDFSKRCVRDRGCSTCGGGFCGHCCGEHHQGHDTAAVKGEGEGEERRRDSFCVGCRTAFCSELCGHHAGGEGHEVVRVDEYGDRHFVRCTGSERWLYAFDGIETFEDEDGNLMVPLEPKRTDSLEPAPGLKHTTRHLR